MQVVVVKRNHTWFFFLPLKHTPSSSLSFFFFAWTLSLTVLNSTPSNRISAAVGRPGVAAPPPVTVKPVLFNFLLNLLYSSPKIPSVLCTFFSYPFSLPISIFTPNPRLNLQIPTVNFLKKEKRKLPSCFLRIGWMEARIVWFLARLVLYCATVVLCVSSRRCLSCLWRDSNCCCCVEISSGYGFEMTTFGCCWNGFGTVWIGWVCVWYCYVGLWGLVSQGLVCVGSDCCAVRLRVLLVVVICDA